MLNKSILQGRLTSDPTLRHTQSGLEVASFTVAWSEKYGENETKCFLDCTAWKGTGKFVNDYFKKGQEILVEGRLQTEEWKDKEGNKRTSIKMTVDKAHFCGPKSEGSASYGGYTPAGPGIDADASKFEELDDSDGDLPF